MSPYSVSELSSDPELKVQHQQPIEGHKRLNVQRNSIGEQTTMLQPMKESQVSPVVPVIGGRAGRSYRVEEVDEVVGRPSRDLGLGRVDGC